ncbi:hypothetical protein TWF694_005393 [Orbilia ellipsospora]|uniref:NACHT domain-containing protein n=1 Tax=Orbilia ellipsospora TaxID=2528407 RepID=A0AAV9WSZ0_9PEZI
MSPAIDDSASSSGAEDDVVVLGRDDINDYNEDNILPEPADVQKSIREWLDPTRYDDSDSEYKKHSSMHLAGTGSWLPASEAFLKWHSSQDDGLLWIRGIPGSGKSVFAAQLVGQLKRENHPVLYFFFRQIIDANHNAEAALRDWLDQILVFSPLLQVKLKNHLTRRRETLSMADLWNLLRIGLSQLPKAYLVVDALDEMDQDQDLEPFLKALAELGEWLPSRVKVIMTSRPIAYIERYLKDAKPINIRLEEKMVDIDIATYVRHRLDIEGSRIPIETRALIQAAVPGRANGLFLFAKLALNAILQPETNVETAIEQLPKDLNNIYVDLLKEHSKRTGISDQIQLLILQSVTHAIRPLRLLELAELVRFVHYRELPQESDAAHEEKSREPTPDLRSMKNIVRSACGPLLEILPDETVSVVHHSFTEFLNGSTRTDSSDYPVLELGSTHSDLALHCLSYLESCLEDPQYSEIFETYHSDRLSLLPPFTKYATQFWHIHVRKSELAAYNQSKIHSALDDFLDRTAGSRWNGLTDISGVSASSLNTAIVLGLTEYIRYLLSRRDRDVFKKHAEYQMSPLCYAAQKGFDEIVQMLLQAGFNPNDKQSNGETALILATSHNQTKVIKILIEAGVDIFEKVQYHQSGSSGRQMWHHSYDESPFELAGRLGKEEAMALYFPHIKTSDQVNSALSEAVSRKSVATVKMLLQHPLTDVNSNVDDSTPLLTACDKTDANPDIIELLLQAGADPNIVVEYGGDEKPKRNTALYALVDRVHYYPHWWASHEEYFQNATKCYTLLIDAGADPNQANEQGNTVLHKATEAAFVRMLLAAGADPNVANKGGETPLHVCASLGALELLLEDPRTQLEYKNSFNKTPLLQQLSWYRTEIALRLLEAGADATAIDRDGDGTFHHVLQALVERGGMDQQIHERLLEAGADVKLRNKDGITVMHNFFARYSNPSEYSKGFEPVLEWLLSNGADVEAKDNKGQTPLFHFMRSFHSRECEERFQRFLKAGAKPDTLDLKGKNLFYASLWNSWNSTDAAFGLLSQYKVDLKQIDKDGNTLWHEACLALYHKKMNGWGLDPSYMINRLSEGGVDLGRPNNEGRTALHMACLFRTDRPKKFKWRINSRDIADSVVECILKGRIIDIDHADKNGITALHLASTCCELNTGYLLEAGSSVSKATHEGLTALHLAARSRQANILGSLLQALGNQVSPKMFLEVLNTRDYADATALYYACASGNYVCVRLLLEAGATVDTPTLTGSPWLACANFEQEELNWRIPEERQKPRNPWTEEESQSKFDAYGVMLGDKRRSAVPENTILPARLDEIVDLLVQYGPSSTRHMDAAIASAAANGFDYTVACLVSKYRALEREDTLNLDLEAKLCLKRREAQRAFLRSEDLFESTSKGLKLKVDTLMSLREYDLVSETLKPSLFLEMDTAKSSTLYSLVLGGFAFLLKNVLTAEVVATLDDWEKRRQEENPEKGPDPKHPLILETCQSDVPCMELLRFLVEDLGVDVNTPFMLYRNRKRSWGREYVTDRTSLHIVATHNRWWQVVEALPYLIKHGADLSARCANGLTPLHAAVNQAELEYPVNRQVIKSLLSHGANPNTSDAWDESCLAQASKSIDVFRTLIEAGAEITARAFHPALRDLNYDILEILLSTLSPNLRYDNKEKEDNRHILDGDEMYPLHYATHCNGISSSRNSEANEEIIKLLLDRGADPCARYPDGTMVMHCIISGSPFISMFIDLPCFATTLEERDSEGRTLLLRACTRSDKHIKPYQNLDKPLVELLLDRGADIRAQTNSGKTALHLAIESHSSTFEPELLKTLVSRAPELVNIADNDGHTPLHYAMDRMQRCYTGYEEAVNLLLSAGANPHLPKNDGTTHIQLLARSEWRYSENGAFDSKKRKLFERLVEMGVDVNISDSSGETPLFYFFRDADVAQDVPRDPQCGCVGAPDRFRDIMRAKVDERPVLEMFDRAGMDWTVVNKSGETLLHVVAAKPETKRWPKRAAKRFKFLLEKGLDVTVEDEKHRTALDVAASQNATDILDLYSRDQSVAEEELDDTSIMEDITKLLTKGG